MVTYYVKQNESYTIAATAECRVYNASGVQVATCPANSSINVKAATGMLKLSDDNAVLKKAVSESGGVTEEVTAHIDNADVHLTRAEKEKLRNVAVQGQTVSFPTIHVTDVVGASITASAGLHVLPLGTKTAMGADACGLSVSASGGLQLFGTHFMIADPFSDTALKICNPELAVYSTDTAAIGFDYANKVMFRSMPNDGTEGTYEFQCWQWSDNTHTSKKAAGVKLLKESQVSALEGNSVLNKSELDAHYAPKNLGTANAVLITDGNGNITASSVISVSELNTLNNNVNNLATKLSNLESRIAALES